MPVPWEIPPEHGNERADTMPFPVGKDERHVRSRGLSSQRRMERRWGIIWSRRTASMLPFSSGIPPSPPRTGQAAFPRIRRSNSG